MKKYTTIQDGTKLLKKIIHHEAEYNENDEKIKAAYDEEIEVEVPNMVSRIVDMTEEEITKFEQTSTELLKEEPTQLDRIEAQTLYTALITDTLIEEV